MECFDEMPRNQMASPGWSEKLSCPDTVAGCRNVCTDSATSTPKNELHINGVLRAKMKSVDYQFTYKDLEIIAHEKDRVFKACTEKGETIAIKKTQLRCPDDSKTFQGLMQHFDQCIDRFLMMRKLEHDNIVNHYGVKLDPDDKEGLQQWRATGLQCLLFMEFCPGGTLQKRSASRGGLDLALIKHYTRQIASGLIYLHMNKVCHLDLKGRNILLMDDKADTVKICDFGDSVQLAGDTTQWKDVNYGVGTLRFMSPEMINEYSTEKRGRKADSFGLGCTIVEMLTGMAPQYVNEKGFLTVADEINRTVANGGRPIILIDEDEDDKLFLHLVQKCLSTHTALRPTAQQIAEHPSLKWHELPRTQFNNSDERCMQHEGPCKRPMSFLLNDGKVLVRSAALNDVNNDVEGDDELTQLLSEVNILMSFAQVRHPNLLWLHGVSFSSPRLLVGVEHSTQQSLSELLAQFDINSPMDCMTPVSKLQVPHCLGSTTDSLREMIDKLDKLTASAPVESQAEINMPMIPIFSVITLLQIAYQICAALEFLEHHRLQYLQLCLDSVSISNNYTPKLMMYTDFQPLSGAETDCADVRAYGRLLLTLLRLGNTEDWNAMEYLEHHDRKAWHEEICRCSAVWMFPPEISQIILDCLSDDAKARPFFSTLTTRFTDVSIASEISYTCRGISLCFTNEPGVNQDPEG